MEPPDDVEGWAGRLEQKIQQIRDHEGEDEQGDEAAFIADLAEPFGLNDEAADGEADDGDRYSHGEGGGEEAVGGAEPAVVEVQEREAETEGEMIQGHEAESAETPEEECVGEAGKGALLDDFGLAEDFPDEFFNAGCERKERETGIPAGGTDENDDAIDALRKDKNRRRQEGEEDQGFHRMQTFHPYHATLWFWRILFALSCFRSGRLRVVPFVRPYIESGTSGGGP